MKTNVTITRRGGFLRRPVVVGKVTESSQVNNGLGLLTHNSHTGDVTIEGNNIVVSGTVRGNLIMRGYSITSGGIRAGGEIIQEG